MSDKIFYKMRLIPEEEGLTLWTEKWVSIQESPCFHYCVQDNRIGSFKFFLKKTDETPLQAAKRVRIKVKRIDKRVSRFAFDTKEEAFDHLRFLKKKQLNHMKRDSELITEFLSSTENGQALSDMKKRSELRYTVPCTRDLVRRHYIFD